MRHISLIFLLSLIPLSAQAIIPLELVAEFELPENVTAWDVQHWMDDSTFGWAAVRNDTVFYVLRMGEAVQAVSIEESYLDSITRDGPPDYTQVLILGGQSPRVIVVANILDHNASQWEDYEYDYYLVIDLESGESNISFRRTTYLDPDWLWTEWWYFSKMSAWPPPPLATQSVRTLYAHHGIYWSPYHTTDDGQFGENSIVDGHTLLQTHATDYDFFVGEGAGVALVNIENRYGSSGYYRDVTTRRKLTAEDSLLSIGICTSHWTNEDENPIICPNSSVHGITSRTGERYVIFASQIFEATTLSLVSEFPPGYVPSFAFGCNGMREDLLWDIQSGNRLRAWATDFSFEDTTTSYNATNLKLLRNRDGNGELIAFSNDNDSIRVLKPSLVVKELVISSYPDEESIGLNWRSFPSATSYVVCRSQFAEGDFCEQDAISVSDTFITLPLINGIDKEFFRVKAVFD